jgi:GH25 family lysozyme M1 (1,4-beta-N-acetylmuramidase)
MYVYGLDMSRWQGDWDPVVTDTHPLGIKMIAHRVTVGDYYKDIRFNEHWDQGAPYDWLQTAYHVVRPDVTAKKQIDHLFQSMGNRKPEKLPIVLDWEVYKSSRWARPWPPSQIVSSAIQCAELVTEWHGPPLIYSAKWFIDGYCLIDGKPPVEMYKYDWWVAHYTEAQEPLLPLGLDTFQVWQYSAGGNGRGWEFGVESQDIDMNKIKWVWFKQFLDEPPPPPPDKVVTVIHPDGVKIEVEHD